MAVSTATITRREALAGFGAGAALMALPGCATTATTATPADPNALLDEIAYNLLRRWTAAAFPSLATWRSRWIRRFALLVPARLLRSGGRWIIRRAPRPMLN